MSVAAGSTLTQQASWQWLSTTQDQLGVPYLCHTYRLNHGQESAESTLIEYATEVRHNTAILYLHGYTDYFFQREMGHFFHGLGFGFFGLELQGYGRSIRPDARPNWCTHLSQYHVDLRMALEQVRRKGFDSVVILAHSTGGLIASDFLANFERLAYGNEASAKVTGLILNSPFLTLPFSAPKQSFLTPLIALTVTVFPFISLPASQVSTYARSIHEQFRGEWQYRLDWKPPHGFPLSFSWLREIIHVQKRLPAQGVSVPTLLCHSKRSTLGAHSVEEMQLGDGVLDVETMKYAGHQIYTQLTQAEIEGGYHDLFLSPEPVRQRYLDAIQQWLVNQTTRATGTH